MLVFISPQMTLIIIRHFPSSVRYAMFVKMFVKDDKPELTCHIGMMLFVLVFVLFLA